MKLQSHIFWEVKVREQSDSSSVILDSLDSS